ncbi:MAG: OmpA family protein [Synergistaceae bacterium]|jgi:chemotaxis protein MotB|nr:OmpA family protein [Synergistaceae bacterium]
MARKKKSSGGGGPGAPLWMATYGDMVTLVLCFFVLLYSFSTIDATKFKSMAESMSNAFNVVTGGAAPSTDSNEVIRIDEPSQRETVPSDSSQTENSNKILALVQEAIKADNLGDEIHVELNERGIQVSISEQLLFQEGSAKLQPTAQRVLYKIGNVLTPLPNEIAVEGHTDSGVPENSIYGDNWGLSSARAASVTSYLNEPVGVPASRLRAVGYAASAPIVPNRSEREMRLNRRVDIMVLSLHNLQH